MNMIPPEHQLVRVDAEIAIEMVNYDQMETRAWRHAFAAEKFPLKDQKILSIVTSQAYSWSGKVTTMETLQAVAAYFNISIDSADRHLRKLERLYLVQVQNEDRGNVWHWNLMNRRVQRMIEHVAALKKTIRQVIELQIAHPDQPAIGKELLPDGVYFNVVHNKLQRDEQTGKEV